MLERLTRLFRKAEGENRYEVVDREGHTYIASGRGSIEELQSWFASYREHTPRCVSCNRIIFPDEPVGKNGKDFMHLTWSCCATGGFHAGHLNQKGELVPAYEDGVNAAMHALRTRSIIIGDIPEPKKTGWYEYKPGQ